LLNLYDKISTIFNKAESCYYGGFLILLAEFKFIVK